MRLDLRESQKNISIAGDENKAAVVGKVEDLFVGTIR